MVSPAAVNSSQARPGRRRRTGGRGARCRRPGRATTDSACSARARDRAARRGRRGEHRLELGHPFLGAGEVPEPAERGGQPQPEIGRRGGPGPRPARPAGCPARARSRASAPSCPAPRSRRSASRGQAGEVRGVRGLDPFPLTGLIEAFGGVLAQRLQHAEAGPVPRAPPGSGRPGGHAGRGRRIVADRDRRCRDRRCRVGAHLLGRVQAPPAPEHRQPPEQHPLGIGEQLVAPVDGRAQRPLPRVRGPGPGGEQPEPVVEPGGDLVRPAAASPAPRPAPAPAAARRAGGRSAPPRARCPGRGRRRDPRRGRARRTAAPRRTRRVRPARRPRPGSAGAPAGTAPPRRCPSGSRLVASSRTPGHAASSRAASSAHAGDEVFAVVQHDQRVAAAQLPQHPVFGVPGPVGAPTASATAGAIAAGLGHPGQRHDHQRPVRSAASAALGGRRPGRRGWSCPPRPAR